MNSAPELLPMVNGTPTCKIHGPRYETYCTVCFLTAALAKQGSPPADGRVNCGTPPDRIWVHPWRETLYYSPTDQPDYIEYTRASPPADTVERCVWAVDDVMESDMWETTCGAAFQFLDGEPEDNGFKFCYKCGKPIEVSRRSEDDDED